MAKTWSISFSDEARRKLRKLDKQAQNEIFRYMEQCIARAENPRHFGKPLQGTLAGLWCYRVIDYRIICQIVDSEIKVLVLSVGHRRDVYE